MRPSQGPLARLRPVAAPLLLTLFVASAEVVPAVHLATHRNDHTHGPASDGHTHETPAHDDLDSEAHDHGHSAGGLAWLTGWFEGHHHDDVDADYDHPVARRDSDDRDDHDHDRTPAGDHGDGSSAHFLLTLVDGPPPLFLPPPPETLAAPPDTAIETCHPAPLPQPPARGPPCLA